MAEDQGGPRDSHTISWLKIFSAFRIALDPKKLLLAGLGLLVMSIGWWLLSVIFFSMWSTPPEWSDVDLPKDKTEREQAWETFEQRRAAWNLLYKMAGPRPESREDALYPTAADLADTLDQYKALKRIEDHVNLYEADVEVDMEAGTVKVDGKEYSFKVNQASAKKTLNDSPTVGDVKSLLMTNQIEDTSKGKTLTETLDKAKPLDPLSQYGKLILRARNSPKPAGLLRAWPWSDYRGPNPYLLVMDEDPSGAYNRGFVSWFMNDQIPVLLEPLYKFLGPVVFWFNPAASSWNRLYLFFVILWTLATWGLFAGAITRMAAVQVARNERSGPMESLRFAKSRYQSYFSAPIIPLIIVGVVLFLLFLFGFFQCFLFFFGDIVIAGVLWTLVLLAGLVIAVVLIGLIGWPMMYATISSEGSDSFDALSRSYSYVYQAPWHYLWYSIVALAYGAVLVFFVGLVGSLVVYFGKFGVNNGVLLQSREPSYLFIYTPTSFGWRDLLLSGGRNVETKEVPAAGWGAGSGRLVRRYTLTKEYRDSLAWNNYVGAFLVGLWLSLLFLFIVGFGYSYFWTASTIIYLLMRRKVDDTEMDEIHLEEDEMEEPLPPEPSPPPQQEGGQMVASPTLRSPTPESSPPTSGDNQGAPSGQPPEQPQQPSSQAANTPEQTSESPQPPQAEEKKPDDPGQQPS